MECNHEYVIYAHIFPNGKAYIGLTRTSLRHRFGNGQNYKTCPLVYRAISKYGWENIKHVIINTAANKADAEAKERYYIALYKTTDPRYGYNILRGGDVTTNDVDDKMRIKLGNGWRGKHRSEEDKKKISDGVKKRFERKESNGHFGMKHSDDTKHKMSLSHGARPVNQYTKDGKFVKRWEFAKDADRAGIANVGYINKCCKHEKHYNTAGGYRWEFADGE